MSNSPLDSIIATAQAEPVANPNLRPRPNVRTMSRMFAIDPDNPPLMAGFSPLAPPGCNIRRLMRERKMNGQQLADAVAKLTGADTNRSTISRYVNNNGGFTWSNMHAVARALDVSIEQLMTPPHLLNLPPEVHRLLALPEHQRAPVLALLSQALDLAER